MIAAPPSPLPSSRLTAPRSIGANPSPFFALGTFTPLAPILGGSGARGSYLPGQPACRKGRAGSQAPCRRNSSRGLLGQRVPFPHSFLTLRKISPIIATHTKNTRGYGGLPAYREAGTYKPQNKKVSGGLPARRSLPAVAGQVLTDPRKSGGRVCLSPQLVRLAVCSPLVTRHFLPLSLHCLFPLHWGISPE